MKNRKNSEYSHTDQSIWWTKYEIEEVSKMGVDLPRSILVCWNLQGETKSFGKWIEINTVS